MRLSELKTGEKGVIVKVLGHGGFRKRIVEMGFIRGKMVTVLLNAPLQDPVKYKIMGYEISLRHSEAAMIEVISTNEARQLEEEEARNLDPLRAEVRVLLKEQIVLHRRPRRVVHVRREVVDPPLSALALVSVRHAGRNLLPVVFTEEGNVTAQLVVLFLGELDLWVAPPDGVRPVWLQLELELRHLHCK